MTDRTTLNILQSLGNAMEKGLNGGSFAVVVLKIGEPTLCNYVANVDLSRMKAAMLEAVARWDERPPIKCALCGADHNNDLMTDLMTDICTTCEERAPWREDADG